MPDPGVHVSAIPSLPVGVSISQLGQSGCRAFRFKCSILTERATMDTQEQPNGWLQVLPLRPAGFVGFLAGYE